MALGKGPYQNHFPSGTLSHLQPLTTSATAFSISEHQLSSLPVRSHNYLLTFSRQGRRFVIKIYQPKPLSLKKLKYTLLSTLGAKIPVEYRSCQGRFEYECSSYEMWQKRGFLTPAIVPCHFKMSPKTFALCLEYIEGKTLDNFLRSKLIPLDQKLKVLENVFRQNSTRHLVALAENEHQLVHYDSNLRNIILSEQGPVHIDFEMGHPKEDIIRSVGREVSKLVLEIANILGRECLPAITQALIAAKTDPQILAHLVEHALHRPFGRFHLAMEERRKRRSPQRVTKQDLARTLQSSKGR